MQILDIHLIKAKMRLSIVLNVHREMDPNVKINVCFQELRLGYACNISAYYQEIIIVSNYLPIKNV